MTVDEDQAKIEGGQERDQFRSDIRGLSVEAGFYGSNPDELIREFKKAWDDYLEDCNEQGANLRKPFSGKFNLHIASELHEALAMTADAQGGLA